MLSKIFLCVLLLVQAPGGAGGAASPKLPEPGEVFTIAARPDANNFKPYFTAESLLRRLPEFRPGTPEIKVGAKRWWQSGVIVLKDKRVLFWRTCRSNFIIVEGERGASASYILGDGKDNL